VGIADDFAEAAAHKDAGMEFTIVMAAFPVEGDPVPPRLSGADPTIDDVARSLTDTTHVHF
jgi:hypothetical protein